MKNNRKIKAIQAKQVRKERNKKAASVTHQPTAKEFKTSQNFLTYENGKLINPSRVNTENLPRFFRKGMEKQAFEKTLNEKTDISLIIDKYKEMVELKETENNGSSSLARKTTFQQIKSRVKKEEVDTKIDFSKNMIDSIKMVNDAFKPNYGVGITGSNLKISQPSEENNHQKSQSSITESNRGITTSRDEETGQVKVRALPYTQNPRLSMAVTRKDYFENGLQGFTKRNVKNLLNKKNKNLQLKKSSIASEQEKKKLNNTHIDQSPQLR